MLEGKCILLGITGGIAAYKAAELTRALTSHGVVVRVLMTRAAADFIGAPTLQALSGHPVLGEGGNAPDGATISEAGMDHIALARWCDVLLVAPATADFLARLAHGLADNLLGATCLASKRPLLVAPAMNRTMWEHPATQANVRLLADRGVIFVGPETGTQACGEKGPGRMAEPTTLLASLEDALAPVSLVGRSLLVSAGPTHEPIDPVRYLGNRSSGRMGYAIARAAAATGAHVTLVSGPVDLETPLGVRRIDVEMARELCTTILDEASSHDIYISAAAVADYSLAGLSKDKLKGAELHLKLQRNPDILASVAALAKRPYLVGFAAETNHLRKRALAKLRAKRLDMIVANQVGGPEKGFGNVQTQLLVLWEGGGMELTRAPKNEQARRLVRLVAKRYDGDKGDSNSQRTSTHH